MKDIFENDSGEEIQDFKVNDKYADKYQSWKKSEEVSNLKRKYAESSQESSSEEEEDELGDLITPELDSQITQTIKLLREKDPIIYNQEKKFFNPDDDVPVIQKTEKPFRIKDYHRRELLGNAPIEDLPRVEQDKLLSKEIKEAFANAIQDDDQDDLLTVVEKSKVDADKTTESIQPLDENESFLWEFINGKKWMDQDSMQNNELLEMSDEERGIEATDAFEAKFNFRFEEQGGESLVSHSRDINASLRRKDDKRKRMREKKNERKEAEKIKKEEELKRLKNLKREEIKERLKKIEQVSGTKVGDLEEFLSRDFDPNDFDNHMGKTFSQDYYSQKEKMFPLEDSQEISEDFNPEEIHGNQEKPDSYNEILEIKKQSLLDDLYSLDYEDLIGDLPVRFKYRSVDPNSFGIDAKDIINAEEKDLNEFISLKKLAPYRPPEKVKKDYKSWKKHGKTKIKELKSRLKKRKDPINDKIEIDSRLASYQL